jgi:hypothetical protein
LTSRGFIRFNPPGHGHEPFHTGLSAAFYQSTRLTGQPRQLVNQSDVAARFRAAVAHYFPHPSRVFTPLSSQPVTGAVLTIDGDGFGSSRGSSRFNQFRTPTGAAREDRYLAVCSLRCGCWPFIWRPARRFKDEDASPTLTG